VDASLTMPGFRPASVKDGTQPLAGQLTMRVQSIAAVQAFVPDLTRVNGQVQADVRLLGTTSHPRWAGDARLMGASARVPRFGLDLRNAELTARGTESGDMTFNGGVSSGRGRLSLNGTANAKPAGLAAVDATLSGQNLTASAIRELTLIVSPDLHLSVLKDSLKLEGQVDVPRADVREPKPVKPPVTPSADVVFVNSAEEEKKREPFKLHSEIRLVLGRDIRVRARGLDGKPTGSVLMIQTPGQPLLATGQLQLTEGTYTAYGTKLTIENGRLVFGGGPIENPGLDIRASRQAKDGVTAGLELHGTLLAPQLTVFSDPPMAERDALSYVVLGHSLDQSSQNENGIVSKAANTLGVSGGDYVAGTLARQLGLDEASVESEGGTFENSSLRLGTYLSPRVYVNYGIGILDQVSTLRIQYFLSRMWTLQAEAGPENSAQVLYTFERGRTRPRPPAPVDSTALRSQALPADRRRP
jgi:translocation and assembly module TamB